MIYTVKRIYGGWEIHNEISMEKITVPDGAVITYQDEETDKVETVNDKTRADILIRAWKA